MKTLDPDSLETLGPDPDSMNPDPQHWSPREKVIVVDLIQILVDSTHPFFKIYVQKSWIFSLVG
jgi:hypothetical protein